MNFNFSQKQQLQAQLNQLVASTQEIRNKLNGIDATERIASECLNNIADTRKRLEECLLDKASMIEWQHEGLRRLGVSLEIDPTAPSKISTLEAAIKELAAENHELKGKLFEASNCEGGEWRQKYEELEQQFKSLEKSRDDWKYNFDTQSKQFTDLLAEVTQLRTASQEVVEVEPTPEVAPIIEVEITEEEVAPIIADTSTTSILKVGSIVENDNGVFGEVLCFENGGIIVRHVTGQKYYTRNQLRHLPDGSVTIPPTQEARLSASEFISQNGLNKISWEQIRDWTQKDKENLRDLSIAGMNTKAKKAKAFTASLPQRCADYIAKTNDKSDFEWMHGEFINKVEELLNPQQELAPVQQEIPTTSNTINLNDIVMTDDGQIGTVVELTENGATVELKEETKQYSLTQLTWLSSYVPEEKPAALTPHQEFWKKYSASTTAFKSLDWFAIADVVEKDDTKLKELVEAAPESIQKKLLNGHLAELLVSYIKESDDNSDLEWITEPLLTQVEDLLGAAPEVEEKEFQIDDMARINGKDGLWTISVVKGSGWYTLKQDKEEVDAHASELEIFNVGF